MGKNKRSSDEDTSKKKKKSYEERSDKMTDLIDMPSITIPEILNSNNASPMYKAFPPPEPIPASHSRDSQAHEITTTPVNKPLPPPENIPLNTTSASQSKDLHAHKKSTLNKKSKNGKLTKEPTRRKRDIQKDEANKRKSISKTKSKKNLNIQPDSSPSSLDTSSNDSDSDNEISLKEQVRILTKTVAELKRGEASTHKDFSNPQGEVFLNMQDRPHNRQVQYTSGLLAGESLSDKLKYKIWEHKYVDFYDIIYPDHEHSYSLSFNNQESGGSLELLPRKRRALNPREWNAAFDDFFAVYVCRYPHDITELLSYSKFIKELMESGSNWAYYDSQFRKDRELTKCKWSVIRIDLQIKASRMGNNTSTIDNNYLRPKSNRSFVPKGFCFKFHSREARCFNQSCPWKHQCPRCGYAHPAYQECLKARNHIRNPNQHTSNNETHPFNQSSNNIQNSSNTENPLFRGKSANTNLPVRTLQATGGLRQ